MMSALLGKIMAVAALLGGAGLVYSVQAPDPAMMPQMVGYQLPDGRKIMVQSHEVTLSDWNRCHYAGACDLALRPPVGRGQAEYPATGLSFVDVQQYLVWINAGMGLSFRLPSAQEWGLMAAPVLPAKPDPIFSDPALSWASAYLTESTGSRRLEPADSYSVTKDGIGDLDGNVWEWTQSCYTDASDAESCPAFYVMGIHEAVMSYLVRDPARGGCAVGAPPAHLGMRLVLDTRPD